jgi:hypothetical protein
MPSYCVNPPVSVQNLNPIASWLGPPPALIMTPVIIRPMIVKTFTADQYVSLWSESSIMLIILWSNRTRIPFRQILVFRHNSQQTTQTLVSRVDQMVRTDANHNYEHQPHPHGVIANSSGTCGIWLSSSGPKGNQHSCSRNFGRQNNC